MFQVSGFDQLPSRTEVTPAVLVEEDDELEGLHWHCHCASTQVALQLPQGCGGTHWPCPALEELLAALEAMLLATEDAALEEAELAAPLEEDLLPVEPTTIVTFVLIAPNHVAPS